MKKIIYTRADGGVSVVNLPSDATDEDFDKELEMVKSERQPVDTPVIVEDPRPASRFFRGAWRRNGNGIDVDMPIARIIKTSRIRKERDERLAVEDIAYMRADERNDQAEKTRIAAKKQALRDLPATVQTDLEAITTPKELEAFEPVWPA